MIETFLTYGRAYFWHDGIQWSGLAVTLMMLAISLVLGLCVSLPLAIARVSSRRALSWPVQAPPASAASSSYSGSSSSSSSGGSGGGGSSGGGGGGGGGGGA